MGQTEDKRPLPSGQAALLRLRSQAARSLTRNHTQMRTSECQEGAERHTLEWFSMASPSVLEGTPRKNPQSPREKGAEYELQGFQMRQYSLRHGVVLAQA